MKMKLMKTSIVLFILTLFSKILAFFKESVLAYYYGTSLTTDSYLMSQSIVNCIFSAITSALVIGYITRAKKEKDCDNLANSLVNITNIIFILLSIFIFIFSKNIVEFFAPGFDKNSIILTSNMLKIMLPFSWFISFQYLLGANLQIKNVFWYVGVQAILANIVLVLSIVLSNQNTIILALGYGFSIVVQAILVFILAYKNNYRYKLKITIKKETLNKIFKVAYPIFFIDVFSNIMLLIDKMFASQIGAGVISSLNYSNKITVLITTFFISIITTLLLPTMVNKANEKNYENYRKSTELVLTYVLLIILPLTIGILFCNKQVISILFMRGAFTLNDLEITSNLLFVYVLGVPSIALNSILKNQLYSLSETSKSLKYSVISFFTNIVLNIIFIKKLGYIGLAVSSIIASYLLTILLFNKLVKKVGKLNSKNFLINIKKISISTIFMAVILFIIKQINISNDFILLIISVIISGISYILMLKILKFEELNYIINILKIKKGEKNERKIK